MATTKSTTAKSSPAKRPAPVATATAAKAKPATKAPVKAEPEAKPEPAAKPEPVAKAKPAPKAAAAKPSEKPAAPRAKKPATIAPEQRQHYVEIAAYHIAERRGFQPGNVMDDWIQAEAEIDRLLAEGLLGR